MWTANGELFCRTLSGDRMMVVEVSLRPDLVLGGTQQLFEAFYDMGPGGPYRNYDVTADGQRFLIVQNTPITNSEAVPPPNQHRPELVRRTEGAGAGALKFKDWKEFWAKREGERVLLVACPNCGGMAGAAHTDE